MLRGISAPLSGLGGSSHLGLLLRVVLAGITGALIFASPNTTEEQPALVPEAASTRSVVTVGESISASTEIEADMLVVKAISADAVLSGVVTDPNDVVGQFARIPLIAGEQLIESKCELHGRGGGPPLRDPQRHAGDGDRLRQDHRHRRPDPSGAPRRRVRHRGVERDGFGDGQLRQNAPAPGMRLRPNRGPVGTERRPGAGGLFQEIDPRGRSP